MSIFGREPVAWVGVIVAFILAIVQTALGQGLISDVFAGKATDVTQSLASSAIVLIPIFTALIARQGATSAAQPKLPVGTSVLIDRPADLPDDEPPPDGVVVDRTKALAAGLTVPPAPR